MTDSANCLLFMLNSQRYAVETTAVDRIVQLPALTPLPGAPVQVTGVFDLAGTMVPVVDLSVAFHRPLKRYVLSDSVIVLHGNPCPLGILANQVIGVSTVPAASVESVSGLSDNSGTNLIKHVVRFENEIYLLLDAAKLFHYEQAAGALMEPPLEQEFSLREQSVFKERARRQVNRVHEEDETGFLELVVVGLNGEYFGLPLEGIREFCEVRNLTPVPCCPPHIMGAMNLRGEILTVIDMRAILGMPASADQKKIVVLSQGGTTAGAGIDEIHEVVRVDPGQIARLPLGRKSMANEYLGGTAVWSGHVVTILDSTRLLTDAELVVNDEV